MLPEEGRAVTAITRSAAKAEGVRAAEAEAVVCDAYDVDGVFAAVAEARPEVVVHELTDIPRDLDLRRYDERMAGNDRLRQEATPILVRAAVDAGARRVVAQSVAFAYAPDGGIAQQVRARRFPIVGSGHGILSFVHVEEAARATVLGCQQGGPGIYNVVDDDPAPLREWLPVYAKVLGAKRPFRAPVWLARLGGGPVATRLAVGRGASNAKARRELGWEPRYPSWRQGFREALG
jgi:nucleoside-diphosphate-sugar epimerase